MEKETESELGGLIMSPVTLCWNKFNFVKISQLAFGAVLKPCAAGGVKIIRRIHSTLPVNVSGKIRSEK